jgi:hypothetical protein
LLILDANNNLNETALAIQGIPWFSATNALYYVGSNLAIGATITHVLVWFMPSIVEGKNLRSHFPVLILLRADSLVITAFQQYKSRQTRDEHYQKMLAYDEVPMWWYGVIMVASFAMVCRLSYSR